ncbi:helix-turn-helix domain-containing protein [Singulisphaera sp. GP187]|uniref:helix-turn-helix domain-containing protein n=1 Tax=Singulisphaera sp. GP187 TaxID=1882752 RepID=UPI0009FA9D53
MRLSELRQLQELSQADLAERAGAGQANISQIEKSGDAKLSTLARIVGAMGGVTVDSGPIPRQGDRDYDAYRHGRIRRRMNVATQQRGENSHDRWSAPWRLRMSANKPPEISRFVAVS